MKVIDLCRNLKLPESAAEIAAGTLSQEEEYQELKHQYQNEHQLFYERILKSAHPEQTFLSFCCRLACETYEMYKRKGIDEQVFWDTFQDIRIWCEECFQETGSYGIAEYQWFWRLFEMKLFRLGRLEYEIAGAEEKIEGNGIIIERGEAVISIHIPRGEPLEWEACEDSLQKAYQWFGRGRKYICHSWLLYPGLKEVLTPDSNIIRFQERFLLAGVDYREREAEKRIFGWIAGNITAYQENSTLQKNARNYLLSGRALGNGWGILK